MAAINQQFCGIMFLFVDRFGQNAVPVLKCNFWNGK